MFDAFSISTFSGFLGASKTWPYLIERNAAKSWHRVSTDSSSSFPWKLVSLDTWNALIHWMSTILTFYSVRHLQHSDSEQISYLFLNHYCVFNIKSSIAAYGFTRTSEITDIVALSCRTMHKSWEDEFYEIIWQISTCYRELQSCYQLCRFCVWKSWLQFLLAKIYSTVLLKRLSQIIAPLASLIINYIHVLK